jgi:hypothetical protein
LLDIDSSCQEVGRNKYFCDAFFEIVHDIISFVLEHIAVYAVYVNLAVYELVFEFLDECFAVGENDALFAVGGG